MAQALQSPPSDVFAAAFRAGEPPEYLALVNGEYRRAASSQLLDIPSPIDGTVVGRIQALSPAELAAAALAAQQAWPAWNERKANERAEVLRKAAALIKEHKDVLTDLLVREIAKPWDEAETEVIRTADLIHYFAEEGMRYYGEIIWGDSFPGYSKDKLCLVYREPLGVVLGISPFNYPLNLSASKIAPALITGNAIVFKPALPGSCAAICMVECFRLAGVPPGIINVVTGEPALIGDTLVPHPAINMLTFTGGTKTGKMLGHKAGMKPMQMELGGKDAALVLEDADVVFAAKKLAWAAFSYSGQRCTGAKRILLHETVADQFLTQFLGWVKGFSLGDPRDRKTFMGPVISDKAADYIQSLTDEAVQKGAQALCGNEREGRYMKATVLDRVTEDMRLAWEEPFGPTLPILRIKSLEEGIALNNKSQYGLQACIFTRDIDKAFYASRKMDVGTVNINGPDSRGPDHFPFLGVKDSGSGTQGVHYSIEAMSRSKAITLNIRQP